MRIKIATNTCRLLRRQKTFTLIFVPIR